jgi:hypothetical protein
MGKKVSMALLLTLTLTALVIQPVTAQGGEVIIKASRSGHEYTIPDGETGILQAGWGACNQGFVRTWLRWGNYAVTLEDAAGEPVLTLTPDETKELYGPIEPWEMPPESTCVCVRGRQLSGVTWEHVLEDLPDGTYTLRTSIWVDSTLTDGADCDGDGQVNVFRPGEFYRETVNTIIFE